jgi:hypothetical protein
MIPIEAIINAINAHPLLNKLPQQKPLTEVWVLWYNGNAGDSYIQGVYSDHALALSAQVAMLKQPIIPNESVYLEKWGVQG